MTKGRRPLPSKVKGAGKPVKVGPVSGPPPVAPDWLPDVARVEWERVVPALITLGLVSHVDTTALAAYCCCFARWVDAERVIKEEGSVLPGKGRAHPAVKIADDALKQVRAWCAEFGFTPSARGRLELPASAAPTDALDQFLNGE